MLRVAILSMLCCTSVPTYGMKNFDSAGTVKTIYVSPKVTARSLQLVRGLSKQKNSEVTKNSGWGYVVYSPDNSKYAIGSSYYCSHFLNYGEVIHSIRVFDKKNNTELYNLTIHNKQDLSHIRFVENNVIRTFYKGSKYIGSDTVLEWNLSNEQVQ
jgi:hypothetical protein